MKNLIIILTFLFISCNNEKPFIKNVPEWSKNSIMYEVNIRQYTKEGTFKAFEKHLERIKELGVDIIWFMPIHEIGELNRKGSLGSYYSVKDYKSINPEFGTIEDFNSLVKKIHDLDMKVIIDWVANHTSFDHIWVEEKKFDWYNLDSNGNLQPPNGTDWWDVADLNYDNSAMKDEMIECMKFWVENSNIDGYRCDVADWVPIDFWNQCRKELDKIKDVFMLAEAENPELHKDAFDMTYGWHLHFVMNEIANGNKNSLDILDYLNNKSKDFPNDAYRLHFTSNHDENSWKGSTIERLGNSLKTFAALTVTLEGMPLIYNGQEANLSKRLKFFEKDSIDWKNYELSEFYKNLFTMKKNNQALWNGKYGGNIELISNENDSINLCFIRQKEKNKVVSFYNLSNDSTVCNVESKNLNGIYYDYETKKEVTFNDKEKISLSPWEFKIYINL